MVRGYGGAKDEDTRGQSPLGSKSDYSAPTSGTIADVMNLEIPAYLLRSGPEEERESYPVIEEKDREEASILRYALFIRSATPLQRVEFERAGVDVGVVRHLAEEMGLPQARLYDMIGLAKTTAQNLEKTNKPVTGSSGQAAIGMLDLMGLAEAIVERSAADEAEGFDVPKWFGRWLEIPQPALGGCKAGDLLDTPTGRYHVSRLLDALESGVYL